MSSKHPAGLAHPLQNHRGTLPSSAEEKEAKQQGRQQARLAPQPVLPTAQERRGFPCVASRVNMFLYTAGGGKLCQVGLGSLLHSTRAYLGRGGVCSVSSWIPLSQWISSGL